MTRSLVVLAALAAALAVAWLFLGQEDAPAPPDVAPELGRPPGGTPRGSDVVGGPEVPPPPPPPVPETWPRVAVIEPGDPLPPVVGPADLAERFERLRARLRGEGLTGRDLYDAVEDAFYVRAYAREALDALPRVVLPEEVREELREGRREEISLEEIVEIWRMAGVEVEVVGVTVVVHGVAPVDVHPNDGPQPGDR